MNLNIMTSLIKLMPIIEQLIEIKTKQNPTQIMTTRKNFKHYTNLYFKMFDACVSTSLFLFANTPNQME